MLNLDKPFKSMNPAEETYNTWNEVAELYGQKFMDPGLYQSSYQAFCNKLPSVGAAVLDVGCGPGNISRYLTHHLKYPVITGIDYSSNMIELAIFNCPEGTFKVMDCRQLNQLNSLYDGIICGFCIPYLSEVETRQMVADARLLLKSGGILYLSYVEGNPDHSGYITGTTGHRTWFNFYETDKMKSMINSSGFICQEIITIDYPTHEKTDKHCILLANKE